MKPITPTLNTDNLPISAEINGILIKYTAMLAETQRLLAALESANDQLAALSTVCAKMKDALLSARGGLCAAAVKDGTFGMINQALALTPADVADQIAQLQQELDLQRTLTVSEKQAKVERGDMYMEEKERAEAAEAKLGAAQADSERLDWLAYNPEYIDLGSYDEEPDKLRAAIDDQRKSP